MWLSWLRPSSWHSCFVCGRDEAQILTTEMWSRNATTHPWCSVIWMMNNQMKKQEETENWREGGEGGKKKWKEKIIVSSSCGILKIQNCTLSETLINSPSQQFWGASPWTDHGEVPSLQVKYQGSELPIATIPQSHHKGRNMHAVMCDYCCLHCCASHRHGQSYHYAVPPSCWTTTPESEIGGDVHTLL